MCGPAIPVAQEVPQEVPPPENERETDGPFDVSLCNCGSNIVLTLKDKVSHYDTITSRKNSRASFSSYTLSLFMRTFNSHWRKSLRSGTIDLVAGKSKQPLLGFIGQLFYGLIYWKPSASFQHYAANFNYLMTPRYRIVIDCCSDKLLTTSQKRADFFNCYISKELSSVSRRFKRSRSSKNEMMSIAPRPRDEKNLIFSLLFSHCCNSTSLYL